MRREPTEVTIRIVLDLSRRCIETAARRELRRLLEAILDLDQPDTAMEDRLVVLTAFLERTDFGKLRADQPELAGGNAVRVELQSHFPSGKITCRVLRDEEQDEEQGKEQ